MGLDRSHDAAKRILAEVSGRLTSIETEQDARFQIINRFLTEVLDWDFEAIKTETFSEAGYADYLLSSGEQQHLVIEAKRTSALLVDSHNPQLRAYKVGGPALASAEAGIKQAVGYCLEHGVNYAVITTGIVWIAFIPMPGSISYKESYAFVFPTSESVIDNFAVFYDLLSKESVVRKGHTLPFAKENGRLSVTEFEPLVAANRKEDYHLVTPSALASDLAPVFVEFFGALSAESNREMLIECFVETRESKYADASLEKMVRSLAATIAPLAHSAGNQLAKEIENAVDRGKGETVVIVGNPGAGKSTFMERFFDSVLEQSLRSKCLVVRIDLKKADGDLASLGTWLTQQLRKGLERQLFTNGDPSYDELRGLYFRDYQRWSKGIYKPLYESDRQAFQFKFSDHLNEQVENDPSGYVQRILYDVVSNRKLLPCLIFDNGDHFDTKFQEAVFQYSQAIREENPLTFTVMPVTDRSFWRLSKAGPFQTYPSKMFYLPIPPTKEVLEKRVAFLKRKIEESRDQKSYFLTKGFRLTLDDIKGFAASLEEIFLREDFVARRISWLANNNVSQSLKLTQKLILSPHFQIEDLIKAFIAHRSGEHPHLNYLRFMRALLRGDSSAFQQDQNVFIKNVFEVHPHTPTTPLLELAIIKLLIDRAGADGEGLSAYISIEQCRQYFEPTTISESALMQCLHGLLSSRLIEPYDASDDSLDKSQRVAVTYSGRMHYELALTEPLYIDEMAFTTPVRSVGLRDALRSIRRKKMGTAEWQEVEGRFIEYCLEQDSIFAQLPRDSIYDGQRQLRRDLRGRWVDQASNPEGEIERKMPAESAGAFRHSRSYLPVVVSWYDPERGYGFVEGGLGERIYLHKSVLQQIGEDDLEKGDALVCDVSPGTQGRLQVFAVHTVKRRDQRRGVESSARLSVTGAVEAFYSGRGYGFIKTTVLPEDVFFSIEIADRETLARLRPGIEVRVDVTVGKYGKGYMATSLEIIDSASES